MVAAARKNGISEEFIESAQKLAGVQIRDGVEARAAAAHRIPHDADVVLRPAAAAGDGQVRQRHLRTHARTNFFTSLDEARLPIKYLASLFSAGNEQVVEAVMKKLMAVRYYKRWQSVRDMAENDVQQDPPRGARPRRRRSRRSTR